MTHLEIAILYALVGANAYWLGVVLVNALTSKQTSELSFWPHVLGWPMVVLLLWPRLILRAIRRPTTNPLQGLDAHMPPLRGAGPDEAFARARAEAGVSGRVVSMKAPEQQ